MTRRQKDFSRRIERSRPKPCAEPQDRRLPAGLYTNQSQGSALWNHVLIGTSTCVSMMGQYAEIGLPGLDLARVEQLRQRLREIMEKYDDAFEAAKKRSAAGESERQGSDLPADDDLRHEPRDGGSEPADGVGRTDHRSDGAVLQRSGQPGLQPDRAEEGGDLPHGADGDADTADGAD